MKETSEKNSRAEKRTLSSAEEQMLARLRTWRRTLHQMPETGLETFKTAAYCKEQLADTPFEVIELEDPESASFLAFYDLGKEKTIAFRTDMDALPVAEQTGLDFAAKGGKMHACGHDGHMALALGFAHTAEALKEQLPVNLLLIFQAGEETPGGARRITQAGWLEKFRVCQVYGTHLWPMIPRGEIATRPLELMAQACELRVRIEGKSAHAARYKEGIDAMEAGARFLLAAYELEKSLPKEQYRLLRFGCMKAGTVCNAVAKDCLIEGTVRWFLDPVGKTLKKGLEMIRKDVEKQTGAKITLDYTAGYPAVLNDPVLCRALFAREHTIRKLENPEMISEDFAEYQKRVPGIFFFLGTGTGIALHADTFDFDESILLSMLRQYQQLVLHPLDLSGN